MPICSVVCFVCDSIIAAYEEHTRSAAIAHCKFNSGSRKIQSLFVASHLNPPQKSLVLADTLATVRILVNLSLEASLNSGQNLLVAVVGNEADSDSLGTETTATADTVEVGVCRLGKEIIVRNAGGDGLGHVVVDDQIDAFEVDTTTEDVSGDADALVVVLELLIASDTRERILAAAN